MYYFYMGSVLLPIAPENLTLKAKNANKTLTLINEGEINILRDPGLTEFDFKVLIPATQYTFAKYDDGFKTPSYFLDHFEKLKTSKEPFQFKVIRQLPNGKLLFDTDMSVALEDYTVDEKVKEGFDLLVSIKLKQYKAYGTKIVKVIEKPKTTTTTTTKTDTSDKDKQVVAQTPRWDVDSAPEPKTYTNYTLKKSMFMSELIVTVYGQVDGDTLRKLAVEITDLNKGKILNGIDVASMQIIEGTTLVLPPAEKYRTATTATTPTYSAVKRKKSVVFK